MLGSEDLSTYSIFFIILFRPKFLTVCEHIPLIFLPVLFFIDDYMLSEEVSLKDQFVVNCITSYAVLDAFTYFLAFSRSFLSSVINSDFDE